MIVPTFSARNYALLKTMAFRYTYGDLRSQKWQD